MRNTAPIFLNCYSRGGSNILWNIFLTHPDVCSPIDETLTIFRCDLKAPTLAGLQVALRSRQLRLFDQWRLQPRRPLGPGTQRFIDETFFRCKQRTLHDPEMQYKFENEIYRAHEVDSARLVAKNNNGLAFISDLLLQMYPGASFFALVRDPLALYESHRRRGITNGIQAFSDFYERIAQRMLADAQTIENYHIVRFEDIIADPIEVMQHLYELVALDFSKIRKVRFKAKAHLQPNGSHGTPYTSGKHYWFDFDEVHQILDPDINKRQRNQLPANERAELSERLQTVRQQLGYA